MKDRSVEQLRKELIDDTYAMAFGADIPAALLEVPDIERMSDDEVIKEARRRGMIR